MTLIPCERAGKLCVLILQPAHELLTAVMVITSVPDAGVPEKENVTTKLLPTEMYSGMNARTQSGGTMENVKLDCVRT